MEVLRDVASHKHPYVAISTTIFSQLIFYSQPLIHITLFSSIPFTILICGQKSKSSSARKRAVKEGKIYCISSMHTYIFKLHVFILLIELDIMKTHDKFVFTTSSLASFNHSMIVLLIAGMCVWFIQSTHANMHVLML